MRGFRASSAVACICACALAVAGCGASAHDQVQAKVSQFLSAIASHDYKTLCTQVLAPTLLTRLAGGGIKCEDAMRISLQSVHDPILSVGRITVSGSTAQAITLSGARGQKGAFESINLTDTSDGWRISSLATPHISRS